ncbi:TRAP transporter small permease [Mesobacillus maritimus]|uniref:TRAP transporter small permease n=1 Tax=Mesobacillus maritimus TaxID=1643336 RepID=UPI0020402206|nr:TRAP transporter small permease [Mesobacillus maritimus]MCM3584884.1 TRAP transporter small permease [Mesobacillus maritimus]
MKIVKWLDKSFEELALIILSIFTVVVIFLQVFMRYVVGDSLSWSEEIARYAFIWMIYLGVSYGVKKNKHLGVDAFLLLFEKKGQLIIGIIANLCFLVFAVVITYYGIDILSRVTRESAAMQISLKWVYAAPVVGMLLTSVRLIQNIVLEAVELKKMKEVLKERNVLKEETV